MTASVPIASAFGTLRPGSRISSATYAAAFQPEYASITGMKANSQLPTATGPAWLFRFDIWPVPNANPIAMKISSADTFNVARKFIITRPGPTPRRWTTASSHTDAIATSVCVDTVSGTYGSGTVNHGVELALPGTKRSM